MKVVLPIKKKGIIYYTFILIFIIGLFAGLYFGRKFLIPVAFATLFAMLLLPVCTWLESKLHKRWIAVLICDFILLVFLLIFLGFLAWQISNLSSDLTNIQQKIMDLVNKVTGFLQSKMGISINTSSMPKNLSSYMSNIAGYFKSFFMGFIQTLIGIIIVLVYVFFFLFYRNVFRNFILKLTPEDQKENTNYIIKNASKVSYQYLRGRLFVIGIVAVILSIGLSIIGVKNAIFFGVLAAFLDLIPFIGILIGIGLPILMTLMTGGSTGQILGILGIFVFVQMLENYFLTPKIVGSKVKLNPLFTLMIVLIGGYIWQVAGMILFIPFLGMAKVIFDHVDSLHPFGYLIGDPNSRTSKSD